MLALTVDVIGWVGMLLYVVAYALISTGRTSGTSHKYQLMNLAGAVGVATNAFYYGAYPSAVVNVVWFAIAVTMLSRMRR